MPCPAPDPPAPAGVPLHSADAPGACTPAVNGRTEFLLSIDLEDVRDLIPHGDRYSERVPAVTERLLALFRNQGVQVTFFTTGPVARRYRSLLGTILADGHELACHSFAHKPLTEYSPAEFADDLQRTIEALVAAGAPAPAGFRAPVLSMNQHTTWAYEILAQHGLTYSSSVLPAVNPLFGWPEFGELPRRMNQILEIPVSIARVWGRRLPFASGVYFRAIPTRTVQRHFLACGARATPVVSYLHPYDFDPGQERFMHPGIHNSRFYNFLMYYNRRSALDKLQRLLASGPWVRRYREFAEQHRPGTASPPRPVPPAQHPSDPARAP